ncbi:hypothetical protein RHGRI_014782 [Rhododendron griersonianum]|uniref:Uncharacterized protein n=1 Tax=Rhododendron griersonianum TaxID=479676 RepID=A0AAV6KB42_9ERIC|nr:hypothetical protein RHGRI_014782 [Rhododendron griersonianum]
MMRPSLIVKNPGRRKKNGCNFFIWIDPPTCERGLDYAEIMQAKKEELERQVEDLKMMNEELGRGKQKLEEENDALFVKIAELTEINVKLAAQTGPRKTTNVKTLVVVLVVIVFVVGVLVPSIKQPMEKKTLYLV